MKIKEVVEEAKTTWNRAREDFWSLLGTLLMLLGTVQMCMNNVEASTILWILAIFCYVHEAHDKEMAEIAKEELAARYTEAAKALRNNYLQGLINADESYFENIQGSVEEEIGNSISTRQNYLESLNY